MQNSRKKKKSGAHKGNPPPAIQDAKYEAGVPRPHHRFHIEDGNTTLKVNNALFRVHRSTLVKHSTVLSDMLSLPRPESSSSSDGVVMTDAYVDLPGDSAVGWECLFGLLYPEWGASSIRWDQDLTFAPDSEPIRNVVYTAEQWASVVLLANKYVMEGIEAGSVEQLQKARPSLPHIDMLVLAQKVDSKELYQTALQHLAHQDQMLSLEDAQKIGIDAFHRVMIEHVKYIRTPPPKTPEAIQNPYGYYTR